MLLARRRSYLYATLLVCFTCTLLYLYTSLLSGMVWGVAPCSDAGGATCHTCLYGVHPTLDAAFGEGDSGGADTDGDTGKGGKRNPQVCRALRDDCVNIMRNHATALMHRSVSKAHML